MMRQGEKKKRQSLDLSVFPDLAMGLVENQLVIRWGGCVLSSTPAMLKESYSCPNNRSNTICEHKNVDAEESTYIDGPEVVPFFLLRQHTINRLSNHPLCPCGAKTIELGGRSRGR